MRSSLILLVIASSSWAQRGAEPPGVQLARTALRDTSAIHRAVAREQLRNHATKDRRDAVHYATDALRDTGVIRARAITTLQDLFRDAGEAVPALLTIIKEPGDRQRRNAMYAAATIAATATPDARRLVEAALSTAVVSDSAARLVAIDALGDLEQVSPGTMEQLRHLAMSAATNVRSAAARSLLALHDTAAAHSAFLSLSREVDPSSRLGAAEALTALHDAVGIPILIAFLAEPNYARRERAVRALGRAGPSAAAAVPELTRLLTDTASSILVDGTARYTETLQPLAAWAISKIMIFPNNAPIPMRASVLGSANALRADGLGVYAWGVDSASVFLNSGLFFFLGQNHRGPWGSVHAGLRRAVDFDLTHPVAESGAIPRGVIREKEAQIWIWYRRDSATKEVTPLRRVPVDDSVRFIERVEMHFRIGTTMYELQMGPFVEGQGGGDMWFTGVHGSGTSMAQLLHPSAETWVIRAMPGTRARLWSFEDRARPIDRGLYVFPFEIRFSEFPTGPNGSCIPLPASCPR